MIGKLKLLVHMAATISFALLLANGANAEKMGNSWDFSGSRKPKYETLLSDDISVAGPECAKSNQRMYESYARLHPEFRKHMHKPGMRREWRRNLIFGSLEKRSDAFNHCLLNGINDRIKALWPPATKHDHNAWCGGEPGQLPHPYDVAHDLLDELAEYAFAGSGMATVIILGDSEFDPYSLNTDVRYYLQMQLLKNGEIDSNNIPLFAREILGEDAGAMLTPERKQFVDEAFGRGDHRAVLETTDPCEFERI